MSLTTPIEPKDNHDVRKDHPVLLLYDLGLEAVWLLVFVAVTAHALAQDNHAVYLVGLLLSMGLRGIERKVARS